MEIALAVLLVLSFPIIAIVRSGDRDRCTRPGAHASNNVSPTFRRAVRRVRRRRGAAIADARRSTGQPSPPPPEPPEPRTPGHAAAPAAIPADPVPHAEAGGRSVGAALAATSAPPPTPSPAEPAMGFEERFGTQWMVWVGGVALALGGFFLVRYSIEQGWFGPGMRVFLGAPARARPDRRRRMGAPQGEPHRHRRRAAPRTSRASSPPPAPPSPMPTSGPPSRSTNSSARHGLRPARHRRAGDARRRAGARPGARRARAGRRLCDAADRLDRPAEFLGALRLSRGRDRRRLRAGARADVALARDHRDRVRPVLDAAGSRHCSTTSASPRTPSTSMAGFALVATFIVSGLLFGPDAAPGKIDAVVVGRARGLSRSARC